MTANGWLLPSLYGRCGRAGLLLLVVLVAGCGGGSPEPSAAEIAQRAITAVDALQSVHYELTIDGGPAFIDPAGTLNLRQAEGDLQRPDRALTRARIATAGFVLSVRFINVAGKSYMTNPLAPSQWMPAPEALTYNPAVLFDAERGISGLIKRIEGLKKVEAEKGDGGDVYRLTGQLPNESLKIFTGGVLAGDKVGIDLVVARSDGAVRLVRLAELAAKPGQKEPMVWTLALTRHGEAVTIEAPL
jgi:lipoprotein LprG